MKKLKFDFIKNFFKKFDKKKLRSLAYVGIVGGCALFALIFFSVSQFEKAKFKASETMRSSSQMSLDNVLNKDSNALEDTTSTYHDLAVFWKSVTDDFNVISMKNAGAYKGTAIPAYIFSMATLVSFGLVLKDAEKVREKEEKEV